MNPNNICMYRDKTGNYCEFHYPDATIVYVSQIIVQKDIMIVYELMRTIERCCGYRFYPHDVIQLMGLFYKNMKFDQEPKCIF